MRVGEWGAQGGVLSSDLEGSSPESPTWSKMAKFREKSDLDFVIISGMELALQAPWEMDCKSSGHWPSAWLRLCHRHHSVITTGMGGHDTRLRLQRQAHTGVFGLSLVFWVILSS